MQTIALVTAYNPQADNIQNIKQIAKQVDCIYVLDNSDTGVAEAFDGCTNVNYHCFEQNMGLPLAFNYVLKNSSLFDPEDYVIFFDQDSKISDNHIENLKASYETMHALCQNEGGVAPAHTDLEGNVRTPHIKHKLTEDMYRVRELITSSLLTKYKLLSEVDFWNEDLFLDGVDTDLCFRLRKAGYICCMVTNIPFRHDIGRGYLKLGPIRMIKWDPIRSYYYTRDQIYLFRQRYTSPYIKCRILLNQTIFNLLRLYLLPDRRTYARYMKRGYADAFRHIGGRLKE